MLALNSMILILLCCQLSWSREVTELKGNIYLTNQAGKAEQLTSSGNDSAPVISADETKVLFIRNRPTGAELHVISLTGSKNESIVWRDIDDPRDPGDGGSINSGTRSIIDPQFSPDGEEIFFYSQPWNLGLIRKVDLVGGTSIVIAHSVIPIGERAVGERTFEVVPSGKFKGDLIVHKDSEKLTAGRLFLFWLVDPDGRNVGIIGADKADIVTFRDEY